MTTAQAKQDLRELHEYIQKRSSREAANHYLASLKAFAAELATVPIRGKQLDDVRPGMRSIGFRGRVAIVFAVFSEQHVVEIQGFDYAGRQRDWSLEQ